MSKSKFGLPFEYQKYPEYFDTFSINENTDTKNKVIESLLKKHKATTVLDLTCGTGSQVFFLAKRGYKCIGADFSPDLLKIARKKAKKEKIAVKFIDGDMRTLKVGAFDAAITIDNAVGHLTKAGFEKAMKNIHSNLKEGGIYIFDILNLQAMTDKVVANLAYHMNEQVNDTKVHVMQCSTVDKNTGLFTSYCMGMFQKNADKPTQVNDKHMGQIYTAKQLQEMLRRNGFEALAQYGMDGKKFVGDKTISILTVARALR
jgi:ubiquinone/menaquinone biosynthesis C-methylase UbiE